MSVNDNINSFSTNNSTPTTPSDDSSTYQQYESNWNEAFDHLNRIEMEESNNVDHTVQMKTIVPSASLPVRSYSKWSPTQQGATLVWRDVCVYATNTNLTNSNQLKRIINNSTGAIQPGTLMALMGSR